MSVFVSRKERQGRRNGSLVLLALFGALSAAELWAAALGATGQQATAESPGGAQATQTPATTVAPATSNLPVFVGRGHIEGHLALNYSPAGAFAPDSHTLAVISGAKIPLLTMPAGSLGRVLKPHVEGVGDLAMESANYISPTRVEVFARGVIHFKGTPERNTPLIAFQWNVDADTPFGKVEAVGAGGGFSPVLYLPQIGYLGMYKEGKITLWNPNSNRGQMVSLGDLAHKPGLFNFSQDGRWVLLGRVEGNGSPDPIVVSARDGKLADVLQGHQGGVLSANFSKDGRRVVTACEDGEVRLYSTGDWKLLLTLKGHVGPVHWADFSPDGALVASAGQDKTLRVWSAEDGRLLQTLEESREPLLTVAFAPDGSSIAATSEQTVLVWARQE